MQKMFALICALCVLGFAAARAQSIGHVFTPAMSATIDRLAKSAVTTGSTPGIAVGVVEDGRVVYARGFGYGDLATHRRIGAGTEFYVGSITEQFTAAAVLLLVQNGKLSLGDKVTRYVPELTVAGDATVAQLLRQTAGLPDYTKAAGFSTDLSKPIKIADLIAAVDKLPPSGKPGASFAFNDLNYFVAGLIVERASGLPLSDDFQTQIFQPLYMNSTFYASDVGISTMHARGYAGLPSHFAATKLPDASRLLGADGLVSNVYDLAKWDIEMPVLLRVDAERDMFVTDSPPSIIAHGMGWTIDQRNGKRYIWSNGGSFPGYRAMNALLPDDHIAVIVLTNVDATSAAVAYPENIAEQILDVIAPPQRASVDNSIVTRAKEWVVRLADKNVDRTQLTPAFSAYLTDQLVSRSPFTTLGPLRSLVPIASADDGHGGTIYEFLATFAHAHYHYKFGVDSTGKIDELFLTN